MKLNKAAIGLLQLLWHFLAFGASANGTPSDLPTAYKPCGSGKVASVETGDTLTLTDGNIILLADIKSPEYWPKDAAYKSWPYGQTAKKILRQKTAGSILDFYCGKQPQNSLGDKVAHVILPSGKWLQKLLVSEGQSYFFPLSATPDITRQLRAAETVARQNGSGLWSHPAYGLLDAHEDEIKPGWFQLISGKVRSAAKVKNNYYLNFGDNWRTDFTVQFSQRLGKRLAKHVMDPLSLEGSQIEVRGWVEWGGGPKIILTHPDQLQILTVSEAR